METTDQNRNKQLRNALIVIVLAAAVVISIVLGLYTYLVMPG